MAARQGVGVGVVMDYVRKTIAPRMAKRDFRWRQFNGIFQGLRHPTLNTKSDDNIQEANIRNYRK